MTSETTTERVLRVLSHLQQRPSWTAAELAEQLGVSARCIRRDVERLRSLGYPIDARLGVRGGYRLGSAGRMPPLLLDDDEAVATAVALRLSSGSAIEGGTESALRALSKLEQVMPPRLRSAIQAVHGATSTLVSPADEIVSDLLLTLARACRDRLRIRFDYRDRNGNTRERYVEPVQMVAAGPRWYLMAWDLDRTDWRTFRLDRFQHVEVTTLHFASRDHPDPAVYVQHSIATAPYEHQAVVRIRARPTQVAALVPPRVGAVSPDDDPEWCRLGISGEQLQWIAMFLARLDYEMEIIEPAALGEEAAKLAARLTDLAERTRHTSGPGR